MVDEVGKSLRPDSGALLRGRGVRCQPGHPPRLKVMLFPRNAGPAGSRHATMEIEATRPTCQMLQKKNWIPTDSPCPITKTGNIHRPHSKRGSEVRRVRQYAVF